MNFELPLRVRANVTRKAQLCQLPFKPPTEAVDQRRLEIWRLRTDERMTVAQIAKQLSISTSIVYDDLNNQHDQILAALSEYGQFHRKESERELEDFKAHCASYIYDPNVVIRGTKIVDRKAKVVELSKFEAVVKIMPFYLTAMNIQNKMWGLYTVPQAKPSDAPGMMNMKNLSIHAVQELRQLAKRENLPLPPPTNANVIENEQ